MHPKRSSLLPALALFLLAHASAGQTIGLLNTQSGNLDGYVLFAPLPTTTTYLIDKCGRSVHTWSSEHQPGQSAYLLADGSLLRAANTLNATFNAGGRSGAVERISSDGTLLWSYQISSVQECSHHDIHPMPNGNVLVISWERRSPEVAIAAGRDPAILGNSLWSEKILELEPVGTSEANIVWEWHLWDHLIQDFDDTKANYGVVAEHPELVNVNYTNEAAQPDWVHANGIDYNAELDQIILSAHNMSEVWIIDHSTTSEEAAGHSAGSGGHGGDLLYRWGNPLVYGRGVAANQMLFSQHNAQWIRPGLPHAGEILVFNNGVGRADTPYSSIDRIVPPVDGNGHYSIETSEPYAPGMASFQWTAPVPSDFYASKISGAQQLSNGGYMVCDGPSGSFFELDGNGEEVWRYISPVNMNGPMTQGAPPVNNAVFRCTWIAPDDPGLAAFPLTPGDRIELEPLPDPCAALSIGARAPATTCVVAPTMTTGLISVSGYEGPVDLVVLDPLGRIVRRSRSISSASSLLDLSELPDGGYMLRVEGAHERHVLRIIVAH